MLDSYFAAERQRRSRLELKITILQGISEGNQRLAHIMYYAKLPPRLCSGILQTMEQQGLVDLTITQDGVSRKVKRYALTERGKRALDSYLTIFNALKAPIIPIIREEVRESENREAIQLAPVIKVETPSNPSGSSSNAL